MALYFLTYDLRGKRDYKTLYDELAKFNALRMFQSSWCFKRYNTNAKGLRDYFKQFVDADDGLVVSQISIDENGYSQWAGYNMVHNPNQLN